MAGDATARGLILLLDSGPLGLWTNRRPQPDVEAFKSWFLGLPSDVRVLLPEIIDYEHRRELLLNKNQYGLRRLNLFKEEGSYLPLTTSAMLQAAEFWAASRSSGMATADPNALDADVILAGQAASLNPSLWSLPGAKIIVVTTNIAHLSRYVTALPWSEIGSGS